MRFSGLFKSLLPAIAAFSALCVGSSLASGRPGAETKSQGCPSDDSGLKLPAGFCATIFADEIGHARHLVVAPNGVVYVNTWTSDDYPPGDKPPAGGFLVALQDKTGAGKAGVTERFGETQADRRSGWHRHRSLQGLDLRGDQRSHRTLSIDCGVNRAPGTGHHRRYRTASGRRPPHASIRYHR